MDLVKVSKRLSYVLRHRPDSVGITLTSDGWVSRDGLIRGRRHHVHLSADAETARTVGVRHGDPVVLTVAAAAMVASGHEFYLSENGVWLTEAVPERFLNWNGH